MLPFPVQILPGQPIYDQLVRAVKRALASGHLRPGDRFPAIRTISTELGINPNTVQKAATILINLGILEVRTGQGSFIAEPDHTTDLEIRGKALEPLVDHLLIDAARLGIEQSDLFFLIDQQARKLKKT